MVIRALFIFVYFVVFISTVSLQAETVLTWEECVRLAVQNHPDLVSALEDVKQAEADKSTAVGAALPSVDGSVSASDGTSSDSYAYGVSASQLLFDGLKTRHDIKQAGQNVLISRYNYLVASSDIRLRLREAFVGLLRIQELLNISREIVKRRKDSLEMVKLRYEAGREHKGSLLTAEANFAQAEADLRQAERSLILAQRRLKKEVGQSEMDDPTAAGSLEISGVSPDRPDLEKIADQTPFLKALIAKKEAARYGSASANANRFPQIFADADIGRSDDEWAPGEESWGAGVRVSIPIFEGGALRAERLRARSLLRQARADEAGGRDEVIVTLYSTWTSFLNALDNVEVRKKFLESAEMRARISQAQYSNGLISFDDWIIIEDALVNARKNDLEARAAALLAQADWVQAQGRTLDDEK